MTDHEGVLRYFTDDDGIWYVCNCGYEKNLGFDPTVYDAVKVEVEHRND